MKRLVKKSLMNPEVFKGSLNQLSTQGREILKLIEEYKFKLEQTCRLTANDQILTRKLIQKKKQLDAASGQIYSIVFDVENIDITQAYEQQQINTNPAGPSTLTPNSNPAPGPNIPPTGDQPSPDKGEENNEESNEEKEEDIDVEENGESEDNESEENEEPEAQEEPKDPEK